MSNICIIILIGIPGAGKTQLCKFIIEHYLEQLSTSINYISYDEYEEKDSSDNLYKNFRKNIFNKVEILLENLKLNNSQNNKYLVLIDDNMYYRSMRRNYYNLARKLKISFSEIFVTCNKDIAIERNNNRSANNKVSNDIIIEMAKKLEAPLENKWEKYFCTIDSEKPYNIDDFTIINNVIEKSLQNPVLKIEQIVEKNHNSFIHNIDLILRKIVSILLKEILLQNNKEAAEYLSKKLSTNKKKLLNGLKNEEFFLPEYESDEDLFKILSDLLQSSIC